MADEFERSLERMFAAPVHFPDDDAFAAAVQRRLERGDAVRRAVMSVAGGAGAVIAIAQLLSSGLLGRLTAGIRVGEQSLDQGAADAMAYVRQLDASLLVGGEVSWAVAGLAAVAFAFLATRLADQI